MTFDRNRYFFYCPRKIKIYDNRPGFDSSSDFRFFESIVLSKSALGIDLINISATTTKQTVLDSYQFFTASFEFSSASRVPKPTPFFPFFTSIKQIPAQRKTNENTDRKKIKTKTNERNDEEKMVSLSNKRNAKVERTKQTKITKTTEDGNK